MANEMSRFLKWIFFGDNFWCTLWVFLMMWVISVIPINTELINPLEEALNDFKMTDLVYSTIQEDLEADTNIVLVNIGNLARDEVAEQINIINDYEPKVVGIDAFFRTEKDPEIDQKFEKALLRTKNLVLVSKLNRFNEATNQFDTLETSHPKFIKNANLAYANMITKENDFRTSREFSPKEISKNKEEVFFGVKIASLFNPEKAEKILSRGYEKEQINFKGNIFSGDMYNSNMIRFTALDYDQVLSRQFDPSLIKGKIVLFGYMGESIYDVKFWDEDKFYTPLNKRYAGKSFPDMFGVVVHANVISMILREKYIDILDDRLNLFINLLICIINVYIFSFLYKRMHYWYDGSSLLFQLIQSVGIFFCILYIYYYFYIEISLGLALVFLLLLGNFLEIYYGLLKPSFRIYILKKIFRRKIKNKYIKNENYKLH